MTSPPTAPSAPAPAVPESRPGTDPSKRKGSGKSFDELLGLPEAAPTAPQRSNLNDPAPNGDRVSPSDQMPDAQSLPGIRDALDGELPSPTGVPEPLVPDSVAGVMPDGEGAESLSGPQGADTPAFGSELPELPSLPELYRPAPSETAPDQGELDVDIKEIKDLAPDALGSLSSSQHTARAEAAQSAPAEAPGLVTERATVPELFSRLESIAQRGGGTVHLSLDPPDLGRVEVSVLSKGGKVEIEMRSVSEAARTALESGLGDLRSALKTHDLQLARADVQVDNRLAGNAGDGQRPQPFGERSPSFRAGTSRSRASLGSVASVAREPSSAAVSRPRVPGRIDVKV